MVLARNILFPLATKIETFEDVKNWIEAWNDFFVRTYREILNDSMDVHDVVDSPLRRISDDVNEFDNLQGMPLELLRFIFQTYAEVKALSFTESSTKDVASGTVAVDTSANIVDVTGSGWLIWAQAKANDAGVTSRFVIAIDGVTIFDDSITGSTNIMYAHPDGTMYDTASAVPILPPLLMFPFSTSLQVVGFSTGASGNSIYKVRYSLK